MPRRILAFVLAICALGLAASCVPLEELRREDEAACTVYGFKPGTNYFANCLQRESLARRYAIPPAPPPPYWPWGYWGRWWGP
jgi:hypothetical protein